MLHTESPERHSPPSLFPRNQAAGERTVLCVDDHEENRYTRARALGAAGFRVIEAASGADALKAAGEAQPSLIVLDVRLPDLNGFEVCERLKSDPRTRWIPVLHVSAAGRAEEDFTEALAHQSDAYLHEPIEPETLVATARALIRAGEAERRQIEAEEHARRTIAEALELNRSLVEASADSIELLDLEGRVLFISPGGLNAREADDSSQVSASGWIDFWQDCCRDAALAALETAKAGGTGKFQGQRPTYKGTPKWWDVVVSPVLGADGKPERLLSVSRDITGQRHAADELQTTLESIGDGFFACDAECRFVYMNGAAERLLGASRQELLGRIGVEVFPLTAGTDLLRQFQRAAAGEPRDFEYLYEPWGRWFHVRCFPRAGGGFTVYFQDITERKRTEDALRDSERRYSALFANRINAIAHCRTITDEHGKPVDFEILQVNDAYETVTGLKKANVERKRATEIFPGIERFAFDHIGKFGKVALEGGELSFETFFESLERWLSVYAYSPARGEFVAIFTDITQRKLAELGLRESEERFRTLADNISQFAWMADASGWIFWYNCRWYEYTGTTLEEVQGWGWRKLHHPDHVERVVARIKQSFETGEPWEDTFPLRGEDGQYRWFLSRALPIRDGEGRVVRWFGTHTDITEQREAEEALRRNEAKLRAVFRSLAEGVVFLNTEGKVEDANETVLRTFGHTVEELADPVRGLRSRFIRPDGTRFPLEEQPGMVALRTGEAVRDVEVGAPLPDGRISWRLVNAQPVYDDHGNHLGAVVSFFDITDRKRAEEELRAAEARLARTQAFSLVMTLHVSLDGRWLRLPPTFVRFLGYDSEDELLGRPFRDFTHPDDFEADWSGVQRLLRGEINTFEMEKRFIRKDGSVTWGYINCSIVTDEEGTPVHLLTYVRDVNAKKKAEEELRWSEERERARAAELEAVMEAVPVATFIARDPECRHMVGSHRTYDYLRLPPGSNISESAPDGGKFLDFKVMKDGRELARCELPVERAAATGQPVRDFELEVVFEDGTSLNLLGDAVPLFGDDGRPRGAVGAFIDITGRKRSEERLRQAQKLESLGLLAGGIAHDFNNLLTGIMGNASLALEEVGPGPAAQIREVVAGAERAAHLTRQLLAYSGKGQFVVREIDVSDAVNEIAGLVQFSIPKSVDLAMSVQRRLPAVEMDPSQLQQVLMNLVINAGEAIGEGNPGRISISTSMTDLEEPLVDAAGEEVRPGRYVLIEVSDTGSGVEEEMKDKIFDPFFTTKFTGRGLGLAAVAGILRSMGGAIFLESAPGRGSTFRVLLPAAGQSRGRTKTVESAGRGTILVVDDEAAVRNFIGAVLRRQGYRVLLASDGKQALALSEREGGAIAAAILDIAMPLMGARDLLPAIATQRPGTKILLTSGYSEAEARRLCAAYPGAAFIQKPYTAQQISKAIEEVLSERA